MLDSQSRTLCDTKITIFSVLIYGNTAQKKVPNTAECDIIKSWINK